MKLANQISFHEKRHIKQQQQTADDGFGRWYGWPIGIGSPAPPQSMTATTKAELKIHTHTLE